VGISTNVAIAAGLVPGGGGVDVGGSAGGGAGWPAEVGDPPVVGSPAGFRGHCATTNSAPATTIATPAATLHHCGVLRTWLIGAAAVRAKASFIGGRADCRRVRAKSTLARRAGDDMKRRSKLAESGNSPRTY
jgi:hypothetical protein